MRFTRSSLHGAFALLVAASSAVAFVATEREAQACGGCFHPSEDNSIITDHRMVLTVSPQQTTLYDQIRYQGNPKSFAWVLPIKGEAIVGVSSDAVMGVLDTNTSVQVFAPPQNCPGPPASCQREGTFGAADAGSASPPGVDVLRQETVGPYEPVQLRSTDPQALTTWLSQKGYTIGPEIAPVVAAYVAEGFDFLALKLIPGAGVTSMKPVRVSTRGASPVLPLRMVAAGTGAVVGITLWVIGDGRWEPQNFRSFVVKQEELTWNWASSSSNFKSLRAEKNAALGGSAWEIESATTQYGGDLKRRIEQSVRFNPRTGSADLADEYPAKLNDQGGVLQTPAQVFAEDMGFLLGNKDALRVTRMRADLPQASLAADLSLQASADQGELARARQITKEQDLPLCPVYDECKVIGQAPRGTAVTVGSGGGGCATGPSGRGGMWAGLFGLGLVGVAAFRARRRISR